MRKEDMLYLKFNDPKDQIIQKMKSGKARSGYWMIRYTASASNISLTNALSQYQNES